MRHYLDHAATSPLHPEVREPYLRALESVGNPSALHSSGRRARTLFADAIDEIAELLGVPASWVILTCSGTEADNLALRGINGGIATTATEHPAVLETAQALGGKSLYPEKIQILLETWQDLNLGKEPEMRKVDRYQEEIQSKFLLTQVIGSSNEAKREMFKHRTLKEKSLV